MPLSAPEPNPCVRRPGHGLPLTGGADWQPRLLRLTHPPTHPHHKTLLRKKIKFIKGVPQLLCAAVPVCGRLVFCCTGPCLQ